MEDDIFMASNELKNLAMLAKQRLKNASYDGSVPTKKSKVNSYFVKNISAMKKNTGSHEFVTISDTEDLQFLKKVFTMLSSAEDVYNPLGRLIDKKYYDTLSDTEKQFYVLRLSDKYRIAKQKYEESKNTKMA